MVIQKIKLINFKRFQNFTIIPNNEINIIVGDNEAGKSTVVEAIDIVANGNIKRIESIGIDRLLNIDSIKAFNQGDRNFEKLPKIIVELYLDKVNDFNLNGKNNTENMLCDGIRLICAPNDDFISEINESLQSSMEYFPFDYYSTRFSTFADEGYSGYKKKVRTILINNSNINTDLATNDYIRRMYHQYTDEDIKERAIHKNKYRQLKNGFKNVAFSDLNNRLPKATTYNFGLKIGSSMNLENELMIYENDIGIDSKGTGKQVFIKTDFALERSGPNIDIILIEEPENHLSHLNLRKLIRRVVENQNGQLFITTHNSLVSTRLDLQNLLIMHENNRSFPISLRDLSDETAKYFLKAPVANVIEFSLSKKNILVEGPSEYMLFEKFYETVTSKKPEEDNINVMDIHGLSFKRYLEISKLLKNEVIVITDNDKNVERNCISKYLEYDGLENIKIFFENNPDLYTFEVVFYDSNKVLCDKIFGLNALDYMLLNKTEAAFQLLNQNEPITIPSYIREAIEWIRE